MSFNEEHQVLRIVISVNQVSVHEASLAILVQAFWLKFELQLFCFGPFPSSQDGATFTARDGLRSQPRQDGTMSSVVIVRQPSSGFVASSGGNGTTVRGLHQRRSIHKCSAGDSATSFAATLAKCRQQHGRGLEEALKVLGEDDSVEVRGLQAALQEARRATQDRPMAAQVGWKRNRRKSKSSWTPLRDEWPGFGPPTTPPVSETTQPGKIPDLMAEFDRLRAQVKSWRPSARRQGRNIPDLCRCVLQI